MNSVSPQPSIIMIKINSCYRRCCEYDSNIMEKQTLENSHDINYTYMYLLLLILHVLLLILHVLVSCYCIELILIVNVMKS